MIARTDQVVAWVALWLVVAGSGVAVWFGARRELRRHRARWGGFPPPPIERGGRGVPDEAWAEFLEAHGLRKRARRPRSASSS